MSVHEIKDQRIINANNVNKYLQGIIDRNEDHNVIGCAVALVYHSGSISASWTGGSRSYNKFMMLGAIQNLSNDFHKQEIQNES